MVNGENMKESDKKRLLSIQETSEYLGRPVNTLYYWIRLRKIPYVKLGKNVMFDVKDLDALITTNKVQPLPVRRKGKE
jgi:excisionase family DNA binding protein